MKMDHVVNTKQLQDIQRTLAKTQQDLNRYHSGDTTVFLPDYAKKAAAEAAAKKAAAANGNVEAMVSEQEQLEAEVTQLGKTIAKLYRSDPSCLDKLSPEERALIQPYLKSRSKNRPKATISTSNDGPDSATIEDT